MLRLRLLIGPKHPPTTAPIVRRLRGDRRGYQAQRALALALLIVLLLFGVGVFGALVLWFGW